MGGFNKNLKDYCIDCGKDVVDIRTHACPVKELKKDAIKFGQENNVMVGVSV